MSDAMSDTNKGDGADVIRALGRGLEILSLFGAGRSSITLTEAAELTDLPLPTAQRLLKTLVAYRFVRRVGERGPYQLGPALLSLVPPLFGSMTLPDLAKPFIQQVVEDTSENANLAVLDDDEVLYLVNYSGTRLLTINSAPGLRLPLHSTALGKCLLAQLSTSEARRVLGKEPYASSTKATSTSWKGLAPALDAARTEGYSVSNEEFEEGLCSVAMPVTTTWPSPTAVNISAPASRWSKTYLKSTLLPALRKAADGISSASEALGGRTD